ncbi:GTP-binding protein [Iris pallida]|uniref:GTP-binding protein n=1 Tax=Iris pallida TaxID=29817 RepID=A0AAX6HN10_IRIPA|nr:GTP-binding protein [Iris pallida]KAJ6841695.1 GTP-binding protein [Iris pallida]
MLLHHHHHHLLLLPRLLSFPLTTPTQIPSLFSLPTKTLILAKTLTTATSAAADTATEPPHIPLSFPDIQPQTHLPIEKLFVPPEVNLAGDPTLVDGARVLKGSNIVLGPYARDAQVSAADFVKSSARTEECPADGLPEFALVGRSNVGKSSLLNSLVRRKKLALTSKKPGKTQLINHFRINDSWYLVDLPGYGYASAPHELRNNWDQFTKDYFLNRQTLVSVFLLIDASIPAKKIDLEYASWLGQNQIPMTLVFTKCDKRKKKKNGGKRPEENVDDFQNLIREFFQSAPPWIMTSSVTNQGRDEILLHMAQLRNYWLKH